jgi:AraC-like DNA-binding protein
MIAFKSNKDLQEPGRDTIEDFARASIVNLVRREVERRYPELLPLPFKPVDNLRNATVPAGDKRHLINQVLDTVGAGALLSIGQGLRDGDFDPLWQAASRAANPDQLLNGWRRLEGYAHSANRLELTQVGPVEIDCRRYAVANANPPQPAENLLICGVIIALLEIIGCRELRCEMPEVSGKKVVIYEGGTFNVPDKRGEELDTKYWKIYWKTFEPRSGNNLADSPETTVPVPADCNSKTRSTVIRAAKYLSADFLRQWKVGELAGELGMSERSFQRRLSEAELTFSNLVRGLRIQEACRLFQEADTSLALIGFCAGFSDSAHFSRDFRAGTGSTPTAFREALDL